MRLRFLYGDGVLTLPAAAVEHIGKASQRDVGVLLALAAEPLSFTDFGAAAAKAAARLGISLSDVESAVAFWRGTGVLATDEAQGAASVSAAVSVASSAAPAAAPQKPLPDRGLPHYSTEELSDIIERRREFGSLIDACQQTFGKIFNTAEVGIIAGMVDYLGVDGEYVLLLLSHCVRMEKKSLRYAEKTALSLFDEGVTDAAALEERLNRIEMLNSAVGQIRAMFGAASRALTTKEKKMVEKWVCTMKYDMSILKLAYETTVDAIGEPSFAYANTILERWFAEGYRTEEDVERALADYRRKKAGGGSSFDVDDFFEAALKHSYGEQ